jgi:F-type H+-transporting ATPase subunit epsilon
MASNELATTARSGLLMLSVVTPTGAAVTAETDQVEAPSVHGEFGVLPGHRPLLAALRAGVVRYRTAGKSLAVAVGPGFAEVSPDAVTVLTDRCVESTAGDVAAARVSLDLAQKRLDALTGSSEGPEFEEAQREVDWQHALIDAARG